MRHVRFTVAFAFVLLLGCEETKPAPTAGGPAAPTQAAPPVAKTAPVAPASAPAVPAPAKAAPAPAAPAGKVVATYALDQGVMSKLYDAEVAKLPPKDRAAAKVGAEIMKLTQVTVTLHEGGKGEMATTKPPADKGAAGKVTTEALTWEQKGKALTLTTQREAKRPLKCTRAGATLTCVQEGSPTKTVFKRR